MHNLTPRNMTRFLLLALLAVGLQQTTNAQTPLPYSTSFESTADITGWTQYRLGTSMHALYEWNFVGGDLNHYYPVGDTDPMNDWMVSPPFDFSSGATIDSLTFKAGGFGMPIGIDTVAMYLITGDQNPDNATSMQLLHLFTDSTYTFDNVARPVYNTIIPPTAGTSYIGFRYQTEGNWLDVFIDDVNISGEPVAICDCYPTAAVQHAFPNPATNQFQLQRNATMPLLGVELYSMQGRLVRSYSGAIGSFGLEGVAPGLYLLRIEDETGAYSERLVVE